MQVSDSWVRLALAIIPQMERAAVSGKIVPFALARAQAQGQAAQGRLMCCALLGAAAARLSGEDIQRQFLQKTVALCQVHNQSQACTEPNTSSAVGQQHLNPLLLKGA